MTERAPRRVLSTRAVVGVLAAAMTVGVLLVVVVQRVGRTDSPGSAGPPQQQAAPRLHGLTRVVAGQRVTSIAAGNGSVVYGTEAGGVFVTSSAATPRRITGLPGRVVKLAFDPTGRWLAAASDRSELAVMDMAHPTAPVVRRPYQAASPVLGQYDLTLKADRLAVDSTGSHVAAQTDMIGIYDMRDSRPPRWLAMRYECSAADDIGFVRAEFVATFDSCANVWDASTWRMERQVFFPGSGHASVGPDRLVYGTFRHAMLLDYRATSPLPSASAVPGQPHPRLSGIIADKTISTRRSPIQPVADDGHVVTVLQSARLVFWEPATHRTLTTVSLPFPAVCPSVQKIKGPAQFTTSFSPDHKSLVITGYCPPPDDQPNSQKDEGRSLNGSWMLAYPTTGDNR
ncbi:hypothetical protein [Streptomyces alanosinicus]|uniref:WD40 repeat domain-containing protein n=1 Tax=Streptomyces alanosinicus TaxID=68171 RepID=A0A918YRB3_9ACTN|nr:hypothetical protein [Streptomyces alanosinicus]GHE12792.1 hypothetical protein GCM10010339_77590 [Streptomyces alanosinicus]